MSEKYETLLANQRVTMDSFNRYITNFKKCSKANMTPGYLKGRLEGLNDMWNNFKRVHSKLLLSVDDSTKGDSYFEQDKFSYYEELYYEYYGKITDNLDSVKLTKHCETEKITSRVTLPSINLPTFSGKFSDWQSFHDFSVVGDAESLLRSYTISESNYKPAWEALCKRYDNARLSINAQLTVLFNNVPITKDAAHTIRNLLDSTNESYAALKSLRVKVENWDLAIIHVQTQRLPYETRQLWEQKLSTSTEPPTLAQYLGFLETRFRALEAITPQSSLKPSTSTYKTHQSKLQTLTTTSIANNVTCSMCNLSHHIRKCSVFQNLPSLQKLQHIRSKHLCFNCLAKDHPSSKCPSKRGCFTCGRRHHTLIHEVLAANQVTSNDNANQGPISSYVVSHQTDTVLLSTAIIKVQSNGIFFTLRALIDTGSQVSFVTTAVMQRLRLKSLPVVSEAQISGIGKTTTGFVRKVVRFELGSRIIHNFAVPVEAIVLPSLTDQLPHSKITLPPLEHLKNLDLADPLYYQPGCIDVILGADIYPSIIRNGLRVGPAKTPIAQNTALGWILLGPVRQYGPNIRNIYSFFNQIELDIQLRRFWELEEVDVQTFVSEDSKECEQHFKTTHSRNTDGRYVVALPFKSSADSLGSSIIPATSQLNSLERRLASNSVMRLKYHRCIQEYLDLKHMEKIPASEIETRPNFYLPHHGVVKESSSTTKLRVVFNASCKTNKACSLNDLLYTGATLQQDLPSIIIRWRFHQISFLSDMEKMYRQVLVKENDRNFQRILWRRDPSGPIEHFRFRTVTFGVSSAPFLAMRVIQQLIEDEGSRFPLASKTLRSELYVDNVMGGADNLTDALTLQEELVSLLSRGGFHLRQWASNNSTFLKNIPENDRAQSNTLQFQDTMASTVKTLGLEWNHATDGILLKFHLGPQQEISTKRSVLSCIARLYDPLGWYAPVTIVAKILLQKLWLLGLSWDQPLPEQYKADWSKFKNELPLLEKVTITRWLQTKKSSNIELHGFCDASERAYSAAVYLKVSNPNEADEKVSIIMAKTKVAPIKTISLPRLELCGAALLAKLLSRITKILEQDEVPMYCWTDSTIVLAWLAKPPCCWKTFVANRSSRIRELVPMAIWHHVISKDNPADLATRGISSAELQSSTLWWQGPGWLLRSAADWPAQSAYNTTQEIRKIASFVAQAYTSDGTIINLSDFSSYTKLIRITAYVLRFIHRCRRNEPSHHSSFLSCQELDKASIYWFRTVQQAGYIDEIQSLKSVGKVSDTSKLLRFNPLLDKNGILRVGGRLQNAHLPYNEQHPIILPYGNHLTKLLISLHHQKTLHGGLTATLSSLRRNYWIPKLRNSVKTHIHKCVKCFRLTRKNATQMMGNLPEERITPAPLFTNTGLDYAGPLQLRMTKGRNPKTHKGYIALFVCSVTKAIHLEAVSDLTTDALLAALRRFIARRGLCKNIFTDCGTNFVGAKTSLQKTFIANQHKAIREVAELVANDGVNWVFIPPGSPHFGGLWEAGVRSVKHHLRRIVGNAILTYEELATVLTQIEACLNSRPLSPLTDNPDELTPLTPGHFLIGRALTAPPQDDLSDMKLIGLRRWILIQKIQQDFWKRWQREYLHTLQQRGKWRRVQPNLEVGQLVIIRDERLPPLKWMLGRISAAYPGSDGLV